MLKLTSLSIGLLTLISIAPKVQAAPLFDRHPNNVEQNIQRPLIDRQPQPQITVTVNPQTRPEYRPEAIANFRPKYRGENEIRYRQAAEYHRRLEIAREQEARARWEAKHRRHGYDSQRPVYAPNYHPQLEEHREYNGGYRR